MEEKKVKNSSGCGIMSIDSFASMGFSLPTSKAIMDIGVQLMRHVININF